MLTVDDFNKFIKQYNLRRFSRGEIILYQDEVPQAVYFVKKGIVKTYNLTLSGEEKPINFNLKGENFPIGWAFAKLDRAQYYYEAFTDCEVFLVPAEDYKRFLQSNPDSLYELFDQLVGRHIDYQMRINALEQSKAADKVLHTLHFLIHRFGARVDPGLIRIVLPLTQQDMANFMGLTRETTGIELKKLEHTGVVDHSHRSYVVHTEKLKQLMGEEYQPDVSQSLSQIS